MILSRYNKLADYVKRHVSSLVPFLTFHKTFNILHALYEMKMKKVICNSRPFMFRIEPCSLCNLRCISCSSYKRKTGEKRVMELNDYKKIIDKISRYAIRTSLYDSGEPLLNKSIYKMIKYSSDHGISTLMSTNFNLFREEDLDKLFESRLTVLEPCLDGFTQENYVKYRKGGNVEIVKKGIQVVSEQKKRIKAKWPIVDVQVVMFDHIKEEIPLIDNFLKQSRVDRITYRQESLGFNAPETTIKGKSLTSESACFWLYIGMAIGPDGSVFPCCGRSTTRVPYGNILEEDIEEIWNNDYYQYSRSLFSEKPDINIVNNEKMRKIPCFKCNEFKKRKKMVEK